MTRLIATLSATLIASPVLAHEGAHLHPHGFELGTAALGALALVVTLWAVKRR
jgi:hypothetical protein